MAISEGWRGTNTDLPMQIFFRQVKGATFNKYVDIMLIA